jgi:hypothetical protein
MNMIQLQDRLKGLSQEQLVKEMQMPTGQVPQFLVLSEITRRKKMEDAFAQEQMKDGTTTVAQDVVAAAGMPAPFAGQMAGALAPQTDMGMNTGAMPQQSAMPEPVQGMAGGGIVALQEGGRVSATPELVVRGGRQFARMPDGSLIPLSALGFDEADLSGAGSADLAAPSSGVRQGPIPSQGDLDAEYRNAAVGIGSVPLRLPTYGADSMDAYMPGAEQPVLRGGGDAVSLARVLSTMGGLASPDMEAARSYPPRVQGPGRPPRAPLAPDTFVEDFGYTAEPAAPRPQREAPAPYIPPTMGATELNLPAVREALGQTGGGAGLATGLRDAAREAVSEGREMPAWLDRVLEDVRTTGSAITGGMGALFGGEPTPEGDGLVPPDEPVAPIDAVSPPVGGTGGGAGGAGGSGISAMAAQGAPSDYEQELLKMLESREKRATQDKWLALAQAGMALMSSKAPTFGEALGEAGEAGLGALREGQSSSEADRLALLGQLEQSRMGREELALRRQAAAARAAGGGDGLRAKDYITLLMNAEKAAREEAATLAPTGVPAPQSAAQYEDAIARANALRAQYGTLLGVPVAGTMAPERLK